MENAWIPGQIVIEGLEFQGHCGVALTERHRPQPICVDLELTYPGPLPAMDDVAQAVDYTAVVRKVVEIGTSREWALLETLAGSISTRLLADFPVARLRLWVRKRAESVPGVRGSVGVRVERVMPGCQGPESRADPLPARFLREQITRLPHPAGPLAPVVLDVAAGHGRNALYLAAQGFAVEAIDRDGAGLARMAAIAKQRNFSNLTVRTVDLEAHQAMPATRPDLPKERYDIILAFFYLHRPLFPALLQALKPGGVLMYETFLIDNHLRSQHPRRKEFCLTHNELLNLTAGLRVLHYDEGDHQDWSEQGLPTSPCFTAQLLAQRER